LFCGQVLGPGHHPEERSQIETVLHKEGFTGLGAIAPDGDDRVCEIDDAQGSWRPSCASRNAIPTRFTIIQRQPDDDRSGVGVLSG
jgi:hypothetical protein